MGDKGVLMLCIMHEQQQELQNNAPPAFKDSWHITSHPHHACTRVQAQALGELAQLGRSGPGTGGTHQHLTSLWSTLGQHLAPRPQSSSTSVVVEELDLSNGAAFLS